MGRKLIADALADAFLDAVERCRWHPIQQVQLAFRWLEEVARSPPDLELVNDRGDRYSGLFLIVRNRPLYQLAIRHSGHQQHHHRYTNDNRRPDLFDEHPDWDDAHPFTR